MAAVDRILAHLDFGKRRSIDPADVYYIEAVKGGSTLRMRGARGLFDVRPLGEIAPLFGPHGFLRIHRNHMVSLRRIREIRLRKGSRDWEVKLEPPVNRVLPVSREHLAKLWDAFGE